MDIVGMHTGPPLVVHDDSRCRGRNCCIHNPSPHPLGRHPMYWRGIWVGMDRICDHGLAHPDPDDRRYRYSVGLPLHVEHECDGCCYPAVLPGQTQSATDNEGNLT